MSSFSRELYASAGSMQPVTKSRPRSPELAAIDDQESKFLWDVSNHA
jgi:hypothetical protein